MGKFSMSIPKAMEEALDREREQRKLYTVQETIRAILGEYFKASVSSRAPWRREAEGG